MKRQRSLAALLVALVLPVCAYAQQTAPPPERKLQVSRVKSGFVVAPDVRFGRINDRQATFAGAYGGWMTDQTLMIGAGGYWLANETRDFKMAYGGAVVEWFVRGDRQTGVSARALVGGGRATLSNTLGELLGDRVNRIDEVMRFGRFRDGGGYGHGLEFDLRDISASRLRYSDDFFIAEPQINGFVKVTDWMRFNVGVGYRLIGGGSTTGIDERLRGLSGSVAVVFGGN